MNNKGFAVTALIYGLAILVLLLIVIIMATLSSMRSNIKDMSSQVEKELLSLSTSNMEYTSSEVGHNVFTTTSSGEGFYRVEVWSPPKYDASGKNPTGTYVSGVIRLEENQKIYIYRGRVDSISKDATYITSIKPGEDNQYYDGFYDESFNMDKMILYADDTVGKLIGGTNDESRQLSYDYKTRYNNDGYYMLRYRFINTKVIKNIPYNDKIIGSRGKVVIRKLLPGTNPTIIDTKNTNYWGIQGLIIDVTEGSYDSNSPCKVYMTHDGLTSCFDIGYDVNNKENAISSYYTAACKNGPSSISFPYQTGTDVSYYVSRVDDLSLICPENNQNVNYEIYINGGNHKKNATSHKYYTTIYNGKYSHHGGEGIKMTPYQPDSIVDKIDSGNFYLLNFETETFALTASTDGNSVSMTGFAGLNTQKWEISKVKNFDLTTNSFTNEKYNYFEASPGSNIIDKTFKIIELSTFKALDIRLDENIEGHEISAQYTFNPLSHNEPQIWRLIPNQDGSYSIKTIVKPNSGDENVGYVTYDTNSGEVYISTMKDGKLNDNQKFTLYLYDYNTLEEKEE